MPRNSVRKLVFWSIFLLPTLSDPVFSMEDSRILYEEKIPGKRDIIEFEKDYIKQERNGYRLYDVTDNNFIKAVMNEHFLKLIAKSTAKTDGVPGWIANSPEGLDIPESMKASAEIFVQMLNAKDPKACLRSIKEITSAEEANGYLHAWMAAAVVEQIRQLYKDHGCPVTSHRGVDRFPEVVTFDKVYEDLKQRIQAADYGVILKVDEAGFDVEVETVESLYAPDSTYLSKEFTAEINKLSAKGKGSAIPDTGVTLTIQQKDDNFEIKLLSPASTKLSSDFMEHIREIASRYLSNLPQVLKVTIERRNTEVKCVDSRCSKAQLLNDFQAYIKGFDLIGIWKHLQHMCVAQKEVNKSYGKGKNQYYRCSFASAEAGAIKRGVGYDFMNQDQFAKRAAGGRYECYCVTYNIIKDYGDIGAIQLIRSELFVGDCLNHNQASTSYDSKASSSERDEEDSLILFNAKPTQLQFEEGANDYVHKIIQAEEIDPQEEMEITETLSPEDLSPEQLKAVISETEYKRNGNYAWEGKTKKILEEWEKVTAERKKLENMKAYNSQDLQTKSKWEKNQQDCERLDEQIASYIEEYNLAHPDKKLKRKRKEKIEKETYESLNRKAIKQVRAAKKMKEIPEKKVENGDRQYEIIEGSQG